MTVRTAAFVVAITISAALAGAQDTALTVTVESADVYKGPTNVTPVIGHAPRGTVLPIARNLGSWVKVPWPDAPDHVGYVHVTMGRIDAVKAAASMSPASPAASKTTPAKPTATTPVAKPVATATASPRSSAAQTPSMPPPARKPVSDRPAPRAQGTVVPSAHVFGVGGLVGYTSSFGATTRVWRGNHIGFQFAASKNTLTSDVSTDSVTSAQFEPAFIYGIVDRVTDYVWLRPYAGTSVAFRHQSLASGAQPSTNTTGVRLFGGAEFTFAAAPQLGLSVDAGYRRFQESFTGFEPSRLAVTIAGHWYIR